MGVHGSGSLPATGAPSRNQVPAGPLAHLTLGSLLETLLLPEKCSEANVGHELHPYAIAHGFNCSACKS